MGVGVEAPETTGQTRRIRENAPLHQGSHNIDLRYIFVLCSQAQSKSRKFQKHCALDSDEVLNGFG
jgi:hypothetical protein